MKRDHWLLVAAALLLLIAAGTVIFGILPEINKDPGGATNPEGFSIGYGSDTVRAMVLDILEEGTIELGETTQPYQILLVKLLEGPHSGQLAEIDYGKRQIRAPGRGPQIGEEILVTASTSPEGELKVYFTDFVRERALLILFGTFILFSLLVSGWKGIRSLLSMAFSLMVIITWIIPQILKGYDPVVISLSGAAVIMGVTIYFTYGWNLKTHAAMLGTLIALTITGLLASFFIDLAHLTGFSSEDALYLSQQSNVRINMRGLVLGGMLIGALGVLDDLVITQSSAVFELYRAGQIEFRKLFVQAMRIGRDHVAATINTLVLAYAGAALPALLLFTLSGEQYAYLINLEYIAEEIVRTLVGSLGLISAVPFTTALACLVATRQQRLAFLGKSDVGETHHHHPVP
jgi:uncharacterized membrane protein